MAINKAISSNPYHSSDTYNPTAAPAGTPISDSIDSEMAATPTLTVSTICTAATIPAASSNTGKLIFVVDATPSSKLQWSTGSAWVNLYQ